MKRCFYPVVAAWLAGGLTLLSVPGALASQAAGGFSANEARLALLEVAVSPQGKEVVVDPLQRLEIPRDMKREAIAIAPFIAGPDTAMINRPVSAVVVRKYRLPESTFGKDPHHLSLQGEEDLFLIADALRKGPAEYLVRIDGHTDNQGSDSYNEKLARDRAVAAGIHLSLRNGLSPRLLFVKGVGEKEPIESNRTAEGRSRNRRLEILVLRPARAVR